MNHTTLIIMNFYESFLGEHFPKNVSWEVLINFNALGYVHNQNGLTIIINCGF